MLTMKSGFVALLVTCLAGSGLSAPTHKPASQLNQRDVEALQDWAKQHNDSPLTARAARDGIDILTNMLTNIFHGHPENSRSKRQADDLDDPAEALDEEDEEGDGRVAGGLTDTVDNLTGGSGEGPAHHLTDTVDGLIGDQPDEALEGLTGPVGGLTGAIPGGPIRKTLDNALSQMSKRNMDTDASTTDEMLQRRVVGLALGIVQNIAKGAGILGGLGGSKRDVADMTMPVDKRQLSGITDQLGLSGNEASGNDAQGVPIVPLSGPPSNGINEMPSGASTAGSRPKDVAFPGGWPDDLNSIANDPTNTANGFPTKNPKPKKQDSPLGAGLLHGSVLPGVLAKRDANEPEVNEKLGLDTLLTLINKRGKPPGGLDGIKGGAPDLGLSDDLTGAISGGKGKDAGNFPGAIRPIADLLGLGKKVPTANFNDLGGMSGLNDAEEANELDSNPSHVMARRGAAGIPGDVAGMDAATSDLNDLPGIPAGLFGPSTHSNSAHKGNGFTTATGKPSDVMARRITSGTPGGVSGLDATATDLNKLPGIPEGLFGPSTHSSKDDDLNLSGGPRSGFMTRRRVSGIPGNVDGMDAATGDLRDLPGVPAGLFGPEKDSESAAKNDDSETPATTRGSNLDASRKAGGSGIDNINANMATPWRAMKKPS